MRGASRRGSDAVEVSLQNFAWRRPAMATLRHPTLPWFDGFPPHMELSATPLSSLQNVGTRDRLSLVGQFAAHIALLQFAGIADAEFDVTEWVVARKRGSDCRLIRIAARACDAGAAPSPLHIAQQFAEAIDAPPLETLQQSWTRAESIFAEVHRRLRADSAADMRWLQRCAVGEILPPGPDALSAMWAGGGPYEIADKDALDAFATYAALDDPTRFVVIGSEFPIQRYAAFASLDPALVGSALAPAEVADRLLETFSAKHHVLVVFGNLDDESRRVAEMMRRDQELPASARRWMALSTRLAAQRALDDRLRAISDPRPWLESFTTSDAYDKYLHEGALPVDDGVFARTAEPRRSYIAALALLGTRIPCELARDFLRQFLFEQPLDTLIVDGVTVLDGGCFVFSSDAVREHCARHVPEASRPALSAAAASLADRLESIEWRSADDAVSALSALPRSSLTPPLAAQLANALVDCGRYRDARDLAPLLLDGARELLLARCERRSGDYAAALARLTSPSFEAQLLRAEMLRLTNDIDGARAALHAAQPCNDEEKMRLAYERAVLALDNGETADDSLLDGDHYLARRFATYRALTSGDFDAASELAARSYAVARSAAERIDSCLDRVFASFSSGRWAETRTIAIEALAIIDEAQGDRAAAGILFTLTFVEADEGRWNFAAQHIRRLREYYSNDAQRLAELDLLSGYLDFSRGHFDEARRLVTALLEKKGLLLQIREAAALMVDEINWIEQRNLPLRSTGTSCNRELDERHRLMRVRRGLQADPLTGFSAALASWEMSARSEPPQAATRSDKLKLFRSALGVSRHEVARSIAKELSITVPEAAPARAVADVDMLRVAASAEYPFRADLFSAGWCHATRNRLGQWSQDGSRSFDPAALDRIAASLEADWLPCSDRELLFVDGASAWPEASRDAIAAVFRTRAENHRLHRILDQEETPAPRRESMEGIVGESAGMREIFSLIDRIAQRDVPVCVLGESGTGKELVGRAIHRASSRRHKAFTAVNCAALPENLIESELFGHMRGAFTGADRDRAGLIETSDGGTLFLDEIGEMPLSAQAKLLRFLQDGEFRRVGDTANRSADVRIVSATNRKLESAVEEGRFREDLYYRIRGVEVTLPPLRDRGADIMLLAQHFLSRERTKHRSGPQAFTSEVETLLQSYGWPGNVRELQNTIRTAHAMAGDAREIDIEHLPERLRRVRPAKVSVGSYQDAVAHFRRDLIEKSLVAAAGNQNRAAALLKISRQALAYQIRELGIMVGKSPQRPRV